MSLPATSATNQRLFPFRIRVCSLRPATTRPRNRRSAPSDARRGPLRRATPPGLVPRADGRAVPARPSSVIARHIKNVFDEGELDRAATVAKSATVQREGEREVEREVEYFNLDVIISVGYRVKSHRGTQFRIWATQRLREYIVKGFTLDDERLKRAGGGNYFDELLARIRDIRSSEKLFWKKVLEIYATSIDYDPSVEASQTLLQDRAEQDALGGAWSHGGRGHRRARRRDQVEHGAYELDRRRRAPEGGRRRSRRTTSRQRSSRRCNRIVTVYLEFAELQAMNRKPMYMADWIGKLDDFLRLSERQILRHAGKVSHDDAISKAELEYDRFATARAALPSPAEKHFEGVVREVKQLKKKRPPAGKGRKKP